MRSDWENPRMDESLSARLRKTIEHNRAARPEAQANPQATPRANPRAAAPGAPQRAPVAAPPGAPMGASRRLPDALRRPQEVERRDGLIDPIAFIGFLFRNVFKILGLTLLIGAAALAAFTFIPFPYHATALVLVDPREQSVTPNQNVLPSIGTDAATLESVVQIVSSSGFLSRLLNTLDLSSNPAFVKLDDPRKQLQLFRKNLTVERRGATYLVDISYNDRNPERAALYANAVAQAFVDEQNDARTEAATKASDALANRLGELRASVRASEAAVARYKAEKNIIDVDSATTLAQREISDASQQMALARTRTLQSQARYVNGLATPASGNAAGDGAPPLSNELANLRSQKRDLERQLTSLRQTYGPRYPPILNLNRQIDKVDTQIKAEEERVAAGLRRQYETARDEEDGFENDLKGLREKAAKVTEARVGLADLQRQADADRTIYEQYLARFKATDEQRSFRNNDVKIVSPAIAPLRTTRPSLILIAAVCAVLAGGLAVVLVSLSGFRRRPAF